jgi:hypothetical protein
MSRKNPKFKRLFFALLTLAAGAVFTQARAAGSESVYTDLNPKFCGKAKVDGDSFEMKCPGVAGYRLWVLEGDLRSSITVIDPKGQEHPLEYWSVVAGGFSTLGDKAEWRVEKQGEKVVPKALIVRVNASENSENPNVKTSYLAVAKIAPSGICVTEKIPPGPKMNDLAREAADHAESKACLSDGSTDK